MKTTILWIVFILLMVILCYFVPNTLTASAEDKFPTFDSEITRLSKQYAVNEKTVRKIIQCESQNNPIAINYNNDKNGKMWSRDISYFQINDYFHRDIAKKLGYDIFDQWDNLEYGFVLMSKYGFTPWRASSKCWEIDSKIV